MRTQNNDLLRALLNLILASLMWILSSLSFFVPSARTAAEFSDMSENWLVPAGIAFSIWFPIFIGCILYGILQFLDKNRSRIVFRDTGWWTAAGFAGVCGWALISAFAPANLVQWGTALIFVPTTYCFAKAALIFSRAHEPLETVEKLLTQGSVSLIAGWTSIAVFLNWTPIVYDFMGTSVPLIISSLVVLAAALIWAAFNISKNKSKAYTFPIVWGLVFLAVRHLGEPDVPMIGYSAIGGAVILLAILFVSTQKKRQTV